MAVISASVEGKESSLNSTDLIVGEESLPPHPATNPADRLIAILTDL
ncbi:MAG: hypothetical protein WHT47_01595 [Hydrogenothermaceae bacterium]